jgi:hypothetical protein
MTPTLVHDYLKWWSVPLRLGGRGTSYILKIAFQSNYHNGTERGGIFIKINIKTPFLRKVF